MSWFSPHKRHANRFNYIPRYFDPEKEAREQRRAELCGQRLDQRDEEYVPGKYIRTQREARNARRAADQSHGQGKTLRLVMLLVAILFLLGVLMPNLMTLFTSSSKRSPMTAEEYYGDFDPAAPITIVPNDYQEFAE